MASADSLGNFRAFPAEIRNQIYRLALPNILHDPLGVTKPGGRTRNLGILLASRRLNTEASAILFSKCLFKANINQSFFMINGTMERILSFSSAHFLQHLELAIPADNLWGWDLPELDNPDREAEASKVFLILLSEFAKGNSVRESINIIIYPWLLRKTYDDHSQREYLSHPKVVEVFGAISRLNNFKKVTMRFSVSGEDRYKFQNHVTFFMIAGRRLARFCRASLGDCKSQQAFVPVEGRMWQDFTLEIQFFPQAHALQQKLGGIEAGERK
ncbi:uncharacterized protein KY384_003526 [Bacidia gigantensis]|uniref:uncharacterized protein n=1 Tax=Bacidia gigantensis TaxID=2732470 RepID=UPI001D0536AB|nr:uncharacterized protein KY384_003526 [Bacidia gigantensis]KAG8531890.1 hypothetical protein KY384_003526 [Bacidia gigantensis]